MDQGFDIGVLERHYSFLARCPESLLGDIITHP